MVSCDVTGGITLRTKLKMPIFTLYLPNNLQSRVLVFQSLCIRDTISNKTYQNFREKRLFKPWGKYQIWQISQTISYKAMFSQRDNIYLVDPKYNITYQISRWKLSSDLFLYQEMPKMENKVTLQLTWTNFTQNREVCLNQ